MAKRIDPEVRQRQITDAVCAVTARAGLNAATLRAVAAEAGCSVRLVQHYFGSKQQLLDTTRAHVGERSFARLTDQVAKSDGSPRGVLEAILRSLIPTDEESRGAMVMYIAFAADALIANQHQISKQAALDAETEMVRNGVIAQLMMGNLRPGVDAEIAATIIAAMMPGLSNNVLNTTMTVEEAYVTISYQLDWLFAEQTDAEEPQRT